MNEMKNLDQRVSSLQNHRRRAQRDRYREASLEQTRVKRSRYVEERVGRRVGKRSEVQAGRWLMILTSLLSLSCSQSLRGLDDTLTPLAEVKVSVSLSELEELSSEVRSRLRVGIIWAGINAPSEWCSEQLSSGLSALTPQGANDDEVKGEEGEGGEGGEGGEEGEGEEDEIFNLTPELLSALNQTLSLCPDPLGVTPALAGPSALLSEGTTLGDRREVTLTFNSLPPTDVMIGTPDARVAYGSFVVFDDLNQDGALNLGEAKRLRLPSLGESSEDNSRRWRGEGEDPETIYSASFVSLLGPQTRIVFREGSFIESFFYPTGGCEPLKGLSVMDIEPQGLSLLSGFGLGGSDEAEASQPEGCEVTSLEAATVSLKIEPPTPRLQELACFTSRVEIRDASTLAPLSAELAEEEEWELVCTAGHELVVRDLSTSCKSISAVRLADCPTSDPMCSEPAWDERATRPEWWPCDVQMSVLTEQRDDTP